MRQETGGPPAMNAHRDGLRRGTGGRHERDDGLDAEKDRAKTSVHAVRTPFGDPRHEMIRRSANDEAELRHGLHHQRDSMSPSE